MDATSPGEARDVEPIAPAVRRFRPLNGAPAVAEQLARVDRHAVDDSRGERLELAADRRGGRFVEKCETLGHLAPRHEIRPLEHLRERLEVAIAEAAADLTRARILEAGGLIVPHRLRGQAARECEVSVPWILLGRRGEEALGPRKPSRRHGHRASRHLVHGDVEGQLRRLARVVRLGVGGIGALGVARWPRPDDRSTTRPPQRPRGPRPSTSPARRSAEGDRMPRARHAGARPRGRPPESRRRAGSRRTNCTPARTRDFASRAAGGQEPLPAATARTALTIPS